MGLYDLITLILDNLARRKGRVALTAVGVVIGTAAVVILVSLGIGLQQNANAQLAGIGDLTIINVAPNYGGGPGFDGGVGLTPPDPQMITNDTLEELSTIPGVVGVYPRDFLNGGARMKYNRLETYSGGIGARPDMLEIQGLKIQQGSLNLPRGTVIVGSMIASSFMDPNQRPGQEPPPTPDLFDKKLQLDIIKWDEQGNEITKKHTVKVGGVLASNGMDDWAVYMNLEDITAYNEWVMGKRINRSIDGYPDGIVKVDDAKNVSSVYDAIIALGYQAYSNQPYVEGVNSFFLILQVVFGGVGAIALLVAAIGIANTMAMAILERTREIGLMKALGATNRDVLSVFLGEAAGIGLIGGLGGVLFGWMAGQVINVLAVAYLAGQAVQQGGPPPPAAAVVSPPWLLVFALVFATLIGILSGLYPALRAATLIPINALKYE